MRIAEVVSSVEMASAGPSYTVPSLSKALADLGHEVSMLSLGSFKPKTEAGYSDLRFQQDFASVPLIRKLGVSQELKRGLLERPYDIYHTHGLWMMPNVYPQGAATRHRAPFLISPRGMLGDPALAFSARKKKMFWLLLQGRVAHGADCFHATSEQEHQEIRRLGLTQPVAIISNGVHLADENEEKVSPTDKPFVLSLGRIHPKKGLDRLIKAWSQVRWAHSKWSLRIVGPDELGHSRELQRLAEDLQLGTVSIEPAVHGLEKRSLMRAAELFVLATRNENFGLTVAESLACGTPVISTKGAPWRGLVEHGCGWWVDETIPAIADALDVAMRLSATERAAMGSAGRRWMRSDFGWAAVAEKMAHVYEWILGAASRPSWVHIVEDSTANQSSY